MRKSDQVAAALVVVFLLVSMALPMPGVLQKIVAAQDNSTDEMRVQVDGPDSPSAAVGSAITYQGRLLRNGNPVNGTCSMTFKAYPSASALEPMAVLTKSVLVNNGQFSVDLDYNVFPNALPFTGGAVYLGIRVSCGGTAEDLSPRQAITAAPYALSLRPGATMEDGNGSIAFLNCSSGNCTALDVGGTTGLRVHRATDFGVRVDRVEGSGTAVSSHSRSGPSVKAISYSGDLFQGWEEVTLGGSQALRFKVTYPGNVYADGTYSSPAADFAELLPATASLEPGDVLVVGVDGNLTRSTEANADNVAGVFATKPAFLGGQPTDNTTQPLPANENGEAIDQASQERNAPAEAEPASKDELANPLEALYQEQGLAPLSIAGIVPVKVSAENGAILPGDLLTTASLPGHAMKASQVDVGGISLYRPGTIVGKALEPLVERTGVIKVLVTLQ